MYGFIKPTLAQSAYRLFTIVVFLGPLAVAIYALLSPETIIWPVLRPSISVLFLFSLF